MTGFSTLQDPRWTLCRQPRRSQIAAPPPRVGGADAHRWSGTQRGDRPRCPSRRRPRPRAAPAPPPRQTEVTTQMPPTRTAPQQRQPNGMMRAPQSTGPAGARYEQPRSAPTPPPRPAPAPAPSQHFAEAQSEANSARRMAQAVGQSAGADVGGDDRAITAPSTRSRTSGSSRRSRCRRSAAGATCCT